ncbi:MAG: YgcG family protein, partial [Paraburkholderia tropica]
MTTCSLTEAGRVTSVARAVTCALVCLAGLPAVAHAALGDIAPPAEAASGGGGPRGGGGGGGGGG